MRLVATQEFNYGNKALKPGDPFDATDDDARLLKGFGKARGEGEPEEQSLLPIPRKKRSYKRRDMRAEDSNSNGGQN